MFALMGVPCYLEDVLGQVVMTAVASEA